MRLALLLLALLALAVWALRALPGLLTALDAAVRDDPGADPDQPLDWTPHTRAAARLPVTHVSRDPAPPRDFTTYPN